MTDDAWVGLRAMIEGGVRGEWGIASSVVAEVLRAQEKHPPMRSAHEGYAILLEEVDELWEEVRKQNPDRARQRKEALQVAAMAVRFVADVCDVPDLAGEGGKR